MCSLIRLSILLPVVLTKNYLIIHLFFFKKVQRFALHNIISKMCDFANKNSNWCDFSETSKNKFKIKVKDKLQWNMLP